jgi:hypothetical protein
MQNFVSNSVINGNKANIDNRLNVSSEYIFILIKLMFDFIEELKATIFYDAKNILYPTKKVVPNGETGVIFQIFGFRIVFKQVQNKPQAFARWFFFISKL